MSWFWMNMPLAVLFFVGITGIPLYYVLKSPQWSVLPADSAQIAPVEAPAIEQIPELAGVAH